MALGNPCVLLVWLPHQGLDSQIENRWYRCTLLWVLDQFLRNKIPTPGPTQMGHWHVCPNCYLKILIGRGFRDWSMNSMFSQGPSLPESWKLYTGSPGLDFRSWCSSYVMIQTSFCTSCFFCIVTWAVINRSPNLAAAFALHSVVCESRPLS